METKINKCTRNSTLSFTYDQKFETYQFALLKLQKDYYLA